MHEQRAGPTHATQLRNHWWWRPGWTADRQFYTWHLTFDGQHDLHRLVTTYQDVVSEVPDLDVIPLEWLHLTCKASASPTRSPPPTPALSPTPAAEISPAELTFICPWFAPKR